MKRTAFLLLITLIAVIAGLLVMRRTSPSLTNLSKNNPSNPPSEARPIEPVMTNKVAGANVPTDSAKISADQNTLPEKFGVRPGMSPEEREKKLAEWYLSELEKTKQSEKPIQFYGKVVDEEMRPVQATKIHFHWRHASGTADTNLLSSADGTFSMTGISGYAVSVNVSKDGYREAIKSNQIDFDTSGNGSSPDSPVTFQLRRIGAGAALVTSDYGVSPDLYLDGPRDGSSVWLDFFNRKTGETGQLQISQVKPLSNAWKTATEWSYRLAIPGGD